MVNVKEKGREVLLTVKRKALPVAVSAATAISALTVNAFSEGETSSMYQTIADSFKSGISQCTDGIVLIFGAVIPIGLSIIGLYAALGAGKRIFTKLVGS